MTISKKSKKVEESLIGAGAVTRPADDQDQDGNSTRVETLSTPGEADLFLRSATDNFRWEDQMPRPENLEKLRKDLKNDLAHVPVLAASGEVTNVFEKLDSDPFLARADKELIWNCMAVVREMFWQLEYGEGSVSTGYQWNMNWKHTRAEVDQVYDAARLLSLPPKDTRDALLASIFSDAIKSRKNFIIHNVHGAQAAVQALSYFIDPIKPSNRKSMERVARASMEHQIAPPEFMASIVAIMLHHKHKLGKFNPSAPTGSGTGVATVHSIFGKIRDPFNLQHISDDLRRIDFTEHEREMLATLGIEEWHVPHPQDPDSKIGHAVIAGDHSINYNHPEGFAKIAMLRGPDTESIFEDDTIHHSLESAVQSFTDSFRVIRPEVQGLALKGLRRTKTSVERVASIMTEIFNGVIVGPRQNGTMSGHDKIKQAVQRAHEKHPHLYTADVCTLSEAGNRYVEHTYTLIGKIMDDWYKTHGAIPFNPKHLKVDEPGPGKLPFWNHPLKYPERDEDGGPILASLSDLEKEQFLFADKIREIAVELLRAEQWIFSLREH
ncbi:MAG: hypothetical protein SGJ27_26300 [Candidatus Melainabacteria bacterium]|nr:hypothetical protein [Candidatus Melainabacteria bacterium]